MIKLKNLWKIALAAMTMSAMLVACDTTTDKGGNNGGDSASSLGGEGVYSYTVNIADVSGAWGGTAEAPIFSVVLLTDEGLEKCIAEKNFKVNPATAPEYQLGAFGNMKIKDTAEKGTFKVYGANPVNDEFQYYNGVAVVVDDETVTLTVDMTKVVLTDLKALWEGESEAVMTEEDYVELKGYKPYVIALGLAANDEANCKLNAWSADVMAMEAGAKFPADAKGNAPVLPKVSEMKVVCSNFGNFPITFSGDVATCEIEYSLAKATWGQEALDGIAFGVCSDEGWADKFTGAAIKEFDKEATLVYNDGNNNSVDAALLEEGKTYIVTIDAKAKTVKVSKK